MIEVFQLPALRDNFFYVLRESESRLVAVVDPPEATPVIRFLENKGWALDYVFNTHHHRDHVGGNLELVRQYGCQVFGSEKDAHRIPGISRKLVDQEDFLFGNEKVRVFACDGHTLGHIAYWMPASHALFVGDTIFSLGCGGLFEGSARQMWDSLSRLRELPDDTFVYCAHEYTLENSAFALTIEPHNAALLARVDEAKRLRGEGKFTVPSLLGSEKACNPFLRPESVEIQKTLGVEGRSLWEVFAAIRAGKDQFDS